MARSSTARAAQHDAHAADDTPANDAGAHDALASARLTAVRGLIARLGVTVSAELRARFDAQLSDDDAARVGRFTVTDDLLADVLDDVPGVLEAVRARRVVGFGPHELRHTLDLAEALAAQSDAGRERSAEQSAASRRKQSALRVAQHQRGRLVALLRSVTAPRSPERAALDRAARVERDNAVGVAAVVQSLRARAEQLLATAHDDPAQRAYLADKGLSEQSVRALLAQADDAVQSAARHGVTRSAARATQREVDRLEGRLRDQMMRLRQCVEAARTAPRDALDAALPEVRMARSRVRRRRAVAKTPAAPVTP